jgi:hypothetical protein
LEIEAADFRIDSEASERISIATAGCTSKDAAAAEAAAVAPTSVTTAASTDAREALVPSEDAAASGARSGYGGTGAETRAGVVPRAGAGAAIASAAAGCGPRAKASRAADDGGAGMLVAALAITAAGAPPGADDLLLLLSLDAVGVTAAWRRNGPSVITEGARFSSRGSGGDEDFDAGGAGAYVDFGDFECSILHLTSIKGNAKESEASLTSAASARSCAVWRGGGGTEGAACVVFVGGFFNVLQTTNK